MTGDEWTEIALNTSPSTLITGNNGSGKSTLLDALTYGLFGVGFRSITVPQLINDVNMCDMMVEVEFSVGKKNYKIRRGMKPRTFEIYIGGKLVDQDSKAKDYQKYLEQNILKFNRKSFVQIVVLGSASFVPFMQLTPADRRIIIEDLLDIQIFSSMNDVLKQDIANMKEEFSDLIKQISLQNEKINLVQSYIRRLKLDNADAIAEKKILIEENTETREREEKEIEKLQNFIINLTNKTKNLDKVKDNIRKLENLEDKLKTNFSKVSKEKDFFNSTSECPTCKQPIDSIFKEEMVCTKDKTAKEIQSALLKLQEDLQKSEDNLDKINMVIDDISNYERKVSRLFSSITAINKYITQIHNEIGSLQEKNGDASEQEEKLSELEKDLGDLKENKNKLTERKHHLDIISVMLKDSGIKTKIIRQYLPIINKYANKYLAALEFFATFTIDENFKETIHVRGSKERTYFQLSEGQKLRVDLALLFTWREVAKLKNSADTNLLIMDEIFESALDYTGIDDFLRLIQTMSKNVNIVIISPKGDPLSDKFANTIHFKESQGFSVIEE